MVAELPKIDVCHADLRLRKKKHDLKCKKLGRAKTVWHAFTLRLHTLLM